MRSVLSWLFWNSSRSTDELRAGANNGLYRAVTEGSGNHHFPTSSTPGKFLFRLAPRVATCALLLAGLLAPVLQAGDFDTLVARFSHESGATRTHIPFFWVARAAVAVAHPAGTSELNLAIFEHTDFAPRRFRELTDDAVGGVWKPLIRVCARSGESTNIYSRPAGRNLHLLLATLDHGGATFVELLVEPEALMTFLDEHGGSRHSDEP